jgi:hypothetical protein
MSGLPKSTVLATFFPSWRLWISASSHPTSSTWPLPRLPIYDLGCTCDASRLSPLYLFPRLRSFFKLRYTIQRYEFPRSSASIHHFPARQARASSKLRMLNLWQRHSLLPSNRATWILAAQILRLRSGSSALSAQLGEFHQATASPFSAPTTLPSFAIQNPLIRWRSTVTPSDRLRLKFKRCYDWFERELFIRITHILLLISIQDCIAEEKRILRTSDGYKTPNFEKISEFRWSTFFDRDRARFFVIRKDLEKFAEMGYGY